MLVEHDIGRLDVTVNHSSLVGVIDGRPQSLENAKDFLVGKCLSFFFQFSQASLKRGAVDKLHDHVIEVFFDIEIEHLNDVGVSQSRNGTGLSLESTHKIGLIGQIGMEDLDRHVAVEAGLVGLVDFRHTATSQSL